MKNPFAALFIFFIFVSCAYTQDTLKSSVTDSLKSSNQDSSKILPKDTTANLIQNVSKDSVKSSPGTLQSSLEAVLNAPPFPFTISGYIDTYYAMDNDNSNSLDRFPGVAAYKDEYRLNIAQLGVKYAKENVRGSLTIQFGDEPDLFWQDKHKLLQEANVGFSPWENVWIDAGYFITHIGSESIRPMENTFSSFAMTTFYEPFPQAGACISYTGKRFTGVFHIVNGYNTISDNNKNKSAGISLNYKFFKNFEVTYNNLTGNETPTGGDAKLRVFNNLVIRSYYGEHWNLTVNNDFAIQQNSKIDDSTSSGIMLGGFFALRYRFNPKFSLALRGEYLADFDGVMTGLYTLPNGTDRTGLMCWGPSLAFEYNPIENAYLRMEARYLKTMRDLQVFSGDKDYRIDGDVTMGVRF